MSEASAHKLSIVDESTRGTTPTNPRFRALPDTRTTLALTRDSLSSDRITGDRFPAEPRSGTKGVSGDIPADLSARAYDDLIASALQGVWVDAPAVNPDTVDLVVDSVPTLAAVQGGVIPTTNGDVTIEFLDSKTEEVVFRFDPTTPGPAETFEVFGLGTVAIDGIDFETTAYDDEEEDATVVAGDTRKSFSILREFSDFAGGEEPFLLYAGCEVMSWNLSAAANGLAKSTFTMWGRSMVGPSAAAPTNTSVAPAFDTEPFDSFSGSLKIDGVAECIATDYNMTVNNGHASRYVIGCDSSEDASVNQSVIDGSLTIFFEDAVLYKKFVDEGSFALELTLQDSSGNQMIVNLPNLKIGSGTQPDVSGDGPITITINFTAHKDQTLGSHISVQRIYPVAV